jgi:hypothetical protein
VIAPARATLPAIRTVAAGRPPHFLPPASPAANLAPMRIRWMVVALAVALPGVAGAESDKGAFGLGLIIGEPTGVNAKYYLSDDRAIDAAAGAAFIGRGFQVHADYLFHPFVLENTETFVLPFYAGPGLRVLRRDTGGQEDAHTRFGIRGVGGVLFDFRDIPLDVFIEVAIVFDYRTLEGEPFGLDVNAGLGARYYF